MVLRIYSCLCVLGDHLQCLRDLTSVTYVQSQVSYLEEYLTICGFSYLLPVKGNYPKH